jgi:hypothetical protein
VAKPAKRAPKPPAALAQVAGVEQNVRLGLDLLELRSSIKSNLEYGRRSGGNSTSKRSWPARAAGCAAFPQQAGNSTAAREALERRIVVGHCIGAPEIRAAREAAGGRRQAEQSALISRAA